MRAQVKSSVQLVKHVDGKQMLAQKQLVRIADFANAAQHGRKLKCWCGSLLGVLDDHDGFRHIAVGGKKPVADGQRAQQQDNTRYPAKEFLHAQSGLPFLCSGIRERNQVGTTNHNQ